jgi:hypothetical protein
MKVIHMTMHRLAGLICAGAIWTLAGSSLAQAPEGFRYDGGWSDNHGGSWGGARDEHRGDWNQGGSHWRTGSVSIRNSRSHSVSVQLRDSRGNVRNTLWLQPGEREYVRTSANSRWTLVVRQYKTYRRYELDDIGSFDNGRWYVRIR